MVATGIVVIRFVSATISKTDRIESVSQTMCIDVSQRVMTGFDKQQRVRTVVTDRHRMSVRQGEDWGELYDLQADPAELNNLFGDASAASLKAELTEIMLHRMIELQDRAPLPAYRA